MPASDKIFSRGMKGQRPPSRCGNRPGTGKSVDSPACSNNALQQRPPSGHRPITSTSLDSDIRRRSSTCELTRQNAICIGDDLNYKNTYSPRPPSRPPSRPQSRRSRPMSDKGRSRSVDFTTGTDTDKAPLPHPLQSQVSFSKYKPLPSIGFNSPTVGDGESGVSPKPSKTCASSASSLSDSGDISLQDLNITRLSINQVPDEPPDSDQGRLKLAVKLLDGSRHERWFRNTDTLGDVLAFAQSVTDGPLPPCQFCTSVVPRQVFTDMSLTTEDAGLVSRSLLYLEEV